MGITQSQQCFIPANPDVTGIGVRISLYIQSFLIVFFPDMMSFMNIPCPPFYAAGRAQMYMVIAMWIAAIVQLSLGGLSLFHQHAAIHLALLSWNSGFLSWLSLNHDQSQSPRRYWLNFKIAGALLVILIISVVLDMSVRHCQSGSSSPEGFSQLTWVFFGIRLRGHLTAISTGFNLLIVPLVQGVVTYIVVYWRYQIRYRRFQSMHISRLVFLVVWLEVVMGIEMLLNMNPALDASVEDYWGFGQIIPLVLLLPLFDDMWSVLYHWKQRSLTDDRVPNIELDSTTGHTTPKESIEGHDLPSYDPADSVGMIREEVRAYEERTRGMDRTECSAVVSSTSVALETLSR